jgi:hypothetical protein
MFSYQKSQFWSILIGLGIFTAIRYIYQGTFGSPEIQQFLCPPKARPIWSPCFRFYVASKKDEIQEFNFVSNQADGFGAMVCLFRKTFSIGTVSVPVTTFPLNDVSPNDVSLKVGPAFVRASDSPPQALGDVPNA